MPVQRAAVECLIEHRAHPLAENLRKPRPGYARGPRVALSRALESLKPPSSSGNRFIVRICASIGSPIKDAGCVTSIDYFRCAMKCRLAKRKQRDSRKFAFAEIALRCVSGSQASGRAGRQAGRQFERAKQCTAMGYHGIAAALAVLHLGNEAAGCELRIRLNYFMPSMPSFFRAAYIGSHRRETAAATAGTRENRRTKRKRTTRRRQRTRTKRNKNKKRMGGPLDVLYLRLLHTHLL